MDTIHSFHVRGHYSFLSRPGTLFIPFKSVDTIHSFHVRGHYSFLSRPWTLFIPFKSVDTIHSFHVRGHYSFLSRPWTLFIPFKSVDTIHSFHVRGHYSSLSSPWTLFIPFTSGDTIHSFHVRGHYSSLSSSWTLFILFTSVDTVHSFHFLFSRDRSLNPITSLSTWVSTPPAVSTRLILRPRLPRCASTSCLQYICVVSASQVQPLVPAATYNRVFMSLIASCPINLSVGQSCIHLISPSLISNYPYQYPKSHNLGFHQYPQYYTKIKSNQLALNLSPPFNQIFYFPNQSTMPIIDNKTLTSILYIASITKNLSIHHSPYSLFQAIQ